MRNSVTEDMDKFGKVGVEMSCIQSQMLSDYDSAESIADSDLDDGELRKMLASPLQMQSGEGNRLFSKTHSFRETRSSNNTEERSKCTLY